MFCLDSQQFKIHNTISLLEIRSEIRAKNEKKIKRLNNEFLHKFKKGDMVMIRSPVKKNGIDEKCFFGPGKIIESYLILVNDKLVLRHENHLKKFRSDQNSLSIGSTSIFSRKQQSINQPRFAHRY